MLWNIAAVFVVALGWLCSVGEASDATLIALGSSACAANAEITSARNMPASGQPLDTTARYYLRPWFGGLVDKVRVIWSARLTDQVELAKRVLTRGSRAQTYGYQVYIAPSQGARDPESAQQLILLAHELMHTAQYVRYGENLARFCQEYMQGWAQSGWIYEQNPLEREAFDTAFAFAQWLGQQIPATSKTASTVYRHEGDHQPARQTRIPLRVPRVDTERQMSLHQSRRKP
jgi:hypothetical protein